jgi:hypothetical protein
MNSRRFSRDVQAPDERAAEAAAVTQFMSDEQRKRHTILRMKWNDYPNLRKRPPAPAKDRGPVQRAIRRAFAASGTKALTSSAIYEWTHVRRRRGCCKSMPFGIYSRTLRTLRTMCDPVGRGPGIGRPILWRLRNSKGGSITIGGAAPAVAFAPNYFFWSWLFSLVNRLRRVLFLSAQLDSSLFVVRHKLKLGDRFSPHSRDIFL